MDVLYEDNHIIVVVKPQNIPSQPDESGDKDMLTMVKEYIKQEHSKEGNVFLGLVHRLDRPTGGIMVFAKTSKAAERLSQQIRDKVMEKTYLAVVVGTPRDKFAHLSNYLVKNEKTNTVIIGSQLEYGAMLAELDYKLLESREKISLVSVKLGTGRSHQIRVQMAGIGCPVFGDIKYKGDTLAKGWNLALWAYKLQFVHPITKKLVTFVSYPPLEDTPWKYFNVEKYINITPRKD
jgi:23S rRNA pseudouridine1911/1915/1917 synthase